jgi:hypothetical protein
MNAEKLEVVRGSGNVFRNLGREKADLEQLKALLAAEIIKALDRDELTLPEARARTGFAAADFSRIRNAGLDTITVDRLVSSLNQSRAADLRPGSFLLKADFEPSAGCSGVLFRGLRRRHTSAAFQSSDYGLRGIHTLRHLLLRQARAGSGFNQRRGKRKRSLQRFVFALVLRAVHPILVELINGRAFH